MCTSNSSTGIGVGWEMERGGKIVSVKISEKEPDLKNKVETDRQTRHLASSSSLCLYKGLCISAHMYT